MAAGITVSTRLWQKGLEPSPLGKATNRRLCLPPDTARGWHHGSLQRSDLQKLRPHSQATASAA